MDTRSRMEEAVRMLKEAGYSWETEPTWNSDQGGSVDLGVGLITPDGKFFPDVRLLAPNPGYDPLRATTALFIEQWMRQLGIPVTAELTNFNNIRTTIYGSGDYDMFILGWGFDAYPVPDQACGLFVAGNPYHYINPDLDELCNRFNGETDLEEARQQMYAIQEILANDLPYIYLFTTPVYDAYRNLEYPYTDVLGGIGAGFYGLPGYAMATEQ
jgi:peptide/nickel transport system substrate-binding protein